MNTLDATVLDLDLEQEATRIASRLREITAKTLHRRGLVVAIGMSTELGKVARLLDRDTDRSTPLQRRLAAFGKRLSLVVIAICVVIFTVGVLRGESPLLMALTAISLAGGQLPRASVRNTVVVRADADGKPQRVKANLTRLFDKGDLTQNIMLESGDIVIVPETKTPDLAKIGQIINAIVNIGVLRRYGW